MTEEQACGIPEHNSSSDELELDERYQKFIYFPTALLLMLFLIFCSLLTPTEIVVSGLTTLNPNKLEVKWVGTRGEVFSNTIIKAGSFVCEYKVPRNRPPYPCKLRPAIEEEYKQSGEGCFILEAQDKDGKWWCFDATCRLNQFGRYLNHAPGSMANTKPVPPVVVEGQLRVGFVATRQIEAGEEVVWDYQDSGRTLAEKTR